MVDPNESLLFLQKLVESVNLSEEEMKKFAELYCYEVKNPNSDFIETKDLFN